MPGSLSALWPKVDPISIYRPVLFLTFGAFFRSRSFIMFLMYSRWVVWCLSKDLSGDKDFSRNELLFSRIVRYWEGSVKLDGLFLGDCCAELSAQMLVMFIGFSLKKTFFDFRLFMYSLSLNASFCFKIGATRVVFGFTLGF